MRWLIVGESVTFFSILNELKKKFAIDLIISNFGHLKTDRQMDGLMDG